MLWYGDGEGREGIANAALDKREGDGKGDLFADLRHKVLQLVPRSSREALEQPPSLLTHFASLPSLPVHSSEKTSTAPTTWSPF